jgi:23S rRNA-intervening sequence protein
MSFAQASLAEAGYCIHVARRLGYISEAVANELEIQVKEVGAPLAGLIRSARVRLAATTGAAVVMIGSLILRFV